MSHRDGADINARIPAAVILMKLCFATGVLAIPATFNIIGYVPGVIVLLAWGALTTCTIWHQRTSASLRTNLGLDYAYIMYVFRMRYAGIHNIADAAGKVGGPVLREVAGGLFIVAWT